MYVTLKKRQEYWQTLHHCNSLLFCHAVCFCHHSVIGFYWRRLMVGWSIGEICFKELFILILCTCIYILSFIVHYINLLVCQWLVAGLWFSTLTPDSSTNKTDRHDIAEILLKVVLNTINQTYIKCFVWLFTVWW
jgi:hypothetical protein